MLDSLDAALLQLFSPEMLLVVLLATVAGFAIGSMPGLTATMGLALLVPYTFGMDGATGLVALGSLYMGAIYGGAFPAILINTPGTPSSVATAFDGYPMTRAGKAEQAVIGATFASVVGGLIGVAALLFLSPPLADLALSFGPAEYFWIAIFGLTIIASLSSGSLVKGFISGGLGMVIALVGIAPVGGHVRFTFGISDFQGGIAFIPMLIGLFTIPELCKMAGRSRMVTATLPPEEESGGPSVLRKTLGGLLRRPGTAVKSGIIGTVIGIIPGAGGNIASLVSYNEARRSSKTPERFGKGEIDGVVASESANNGVVGGGLVPLLTLGVPGAPPDAIIYGALLVQGLRPGAELFSVQGDLTLTFILSMALAAIAMAPIGIFLGRRLEKFVVNVPVRFLIPGVLIATIVGAYAIRNNLIDVWIMFAAGILGIAMGVLRLPVAPMVLGLILGPIAEKGLSQALLLGPEAHPWTALFTDPLSIGLIVLALLSLVLPWWASRRSSVLVVSDE